MKRYEFLKLSGLTALASALSTQSVFSALFRSKPLNTNPMKTVYHAAESRGHANHGWLKTWHTFSFAGYYDPARIHFGTLRVLNDDEVAGGMGFGTHPHDNMEIITIPLSGALKHRDSMGNEGIIRAGEIQVMSAGTGIQHSEFNGDAAEACRLLQIWLFPREKQVRPRYDQLAFDVAERQDRWQQILSPNPEDAGVWIHQDAWFHLIEASAGSSHTYTLKKPGNGLYFFIIEGEAQVEQQSLKRRDALGMTDANGFTFTTKSGTYALLMEIPMHV
jgi:redox-sensitive bicupin YhaK (pirin superfamily)